MDKNNFEYKHLNLFSAVEKKNWEYFIHPKININLRPFWNVFIKENLNKDI